MRCDHVEAITISSDRRIYKFVGWVRRSRNPPKFKDWKQADERTSELMLKAARREGDLDVSSLKQFPCADLRTINRLWVEYSDGRFGFSVQKGIWEKVGGKPGEYDLGIFERLGELVEWRKGGTWLDYSEYTFSPNAPKGYLPRKVLLPKYGLLPENRKSYNDYTYTYEYEGGELLSRGLLPRLVKCSI